MYDTYSFDLRGAVRDEIRKAFENIHVSFDDEKLEEGVLVRGMQMPKSCAECPLTNVCKKSPYTPKYARLSSCPLKRVT